MRSRANEGPIGGVEAVYWGCERIDGRASSGYLRERWCSEIVNDRGIRISMGIGKSLDKLRSRAVLYGFDLTDFCSSQYPIYILYILDTPPLIYFLTYLCNHVLGTSQFDSLSRRLTSLHNNLQLPKDGYKVVPPLKYFLEIEY
jgi:hypothetical protein